MDQHEYVGRLLAAYRATPGTCGIVRRADRLLDSCNFPPNAQEVTFRRRTRLAVSARTTSDIDNCKLEMFASAAVVRHALIMPAGVVSPSSALGPSTSRITTARSRNACAPLP